jgi:hypothetical protein
MTLCGEWSLVKRSEAMVKAATLKCRRWSCPDCAPALKRRVIGRALSGKPDRMLTLTVNPRFGASPEDRRIELAKAWRLICKRAMRRYGYRSIPCFVVCEATEKGEPHLHVLLRKTWLDQRWVSEVMDELISAPIVHISKISNARHGAWYVAKYLGKEPTTFGKTKRYWCSRDWRLDRKEQWLWDRKETWQVEIIKASLDVAIALLPRGCFTVQWISSQEWVALRLPP